MDMHVSTVPLKKRIAVFANVHNAENLYRFMHGLKNGFAENTTDLFLFMTQSLYSMSETENNSLNAIFDLPDLSTFDAAVIYGPGLNFPDLIEKLIVRLSNAGIPVVSVGLEYPDFHTISVDNYVGMKDLCNHLIEVHNISDILFIAGSKDNSDSNARLQALKDAMAEHNLPFGEENILYTNWEVGMLLHHIYDMIDNNRPFPKAFVCANDLLAETISYAMEDKNYPDYEKQIITGFDYEDDTRAFYPSLASVDQQPGEQGLQAAHLLNSIFTTGTAPKTTNIACKFIPGESCGCQNTRSEDKLRQMIARSTPRRFMENSLIDNLFSSITKEIASGENYITVKKNLQDIFYSSNGREGDTFYLMLDHYFVNTSAISNYKEYEKYKFSDRMDTLIAKYEGKSVPIKTIPTRDLIPGYNYSGKNRIYMFTPVYYENFVCGYIVFTDKLDWIKTNKFIDLASVLKNALITNRRNMELSALNLQLSAIMEKDSLTSVKNRTAYDNFIRSLEVKISANECQPFSVVCFDINNLKEINDTLGHEQGDEYIKNCCKYICDYFKHSRVYRIGGDEFIAILFDKDYINRDEILRNMRNDMLDIKKSGNNIPATKRISIATGMADYNPSTNDTYSDVFKWADEKMYQNKFIMKNGQIR